MPAALVAAVSCDTIAWARATASSSDRSGALDDSDRSAAMCWRRRAAAWISVRWSTAQWTSVSPASARHVAAASPRPVPRPSRSSAAPHRATWSAADRARTASLRGVRLRRSAAVMRVIVERPYWLAQQVDPAVEAPVLGRDVGRRDDVDDPVRARRGPQHHEASTGVVDHLEVNTAHRAVQGAGEQGAEGPTSISWHATQHGQSRMEIYGRGFAVALDNQAFHQHGGLSAPPSRDLSDFFTNVSRTGDSTTLCGGGGHGARGGRRSSRGACPASGLAGRSDTAIPCTALGRRRTRDRCSVRLGLQTRPLSSVGRAQPW